MINIKKPMCTNCAHSEVCKNKDLFLDAQRAVDGLIFGNNLNVSSIKDVLWIRPINLECINFLGKTTQREMGAEDG